MPISRDEVIALAATRYDDDCFDSDSDRVFALLVDVAQACLDVYKDADVPDPDRPESFLPDTFAHQPYGFVLIQGLKENLEINNPDDIFNLTF